MNLLFFNLIYFIERREEKGRCIASVFYLGASGMPSEHLTRRRHDFSRALILLLAITFLLLKKKFGNLQWSGEINIQNKKSLAFARLGAPLVFEPGTQCNIHP
jgi:hypothetical protein